MDLQLKAIQGEKTYRVYYLSAADDAANAKFLFQRPYVNADASSLKDMGIQYLVMNYSEYSELKHRLKSAMASQLVLEASFSPFVDPEKKRPGDPYESTAAPHRVGELFSRDRLGPYLEVYRIKNA